MTQQVKKKLNDSWGMRWGALAIVAFTMMAAYYVNDVVAPLKSMLEASPSENGLGWTSSDFGIYTGAYSFLNVFCLMLIWGGLILDRFGIRFTGKLATILMVVGTWLEYYAMTSMVGTADTILGYKADVFVASAGYSVFGVGAEVAGITVTKCSCTCRFAGCIRRSYPCGTLVRAYNTCPYRSCVPCRRYDSILLILCTRQEA